MSRLSPGEAMRNPTAVVAALTIAMAGSACLLTDAHLFARFEGSADPGARCSIRWDGGPWVAGGWLEAEDYRAFPSAESRTGITGSGTVREDRKDGGRA